MKRFIAFSGFFLGLGLVCGFFFSVGCKTTLEAGGAYAPAVVTTNAAGQVVTNATAAPDMAFYATDAAFLTAYNIVDGVFTWERDNRAFLWKLSPDIKHGLDGIRPTAWEIRKEYLAARETYKANPTPAGLDLLNTLLAKMRQFQATAQTLSANLNSK
jgi:hypothetical protein